MNLHHEKLHEIIEDNSPEEEEKANKTYEARDLSAIREMWNMWERLHNLVGKHFLPNKDLAV